MPVGKSIFIWKARQPLPRQMKMGALNYLCLLSIQVKSSIRLLACWG